MPRGNGLIYDYPYLREAIEEFLLGLVMGDIYDSRDLITHLSSYRGLSRKDKEKRYAFGERILSRSAPHFIHVANHIIREYSLPIVKKTWTLEYLDSVTVLEHESKYGKTMYIHIGE